MSSLPSQPLLFSFSPFSPSTMNRTKANTFVLPPSWPPPAWGPIAAGVAVVWPRFPLRTLGARGPSQRHIHWSFDCVLRTSPLAPARRGRASAAHVQRVGVRRNCATRPLVPVAFFFTVLQHSCIPHSVAALLQSSCRNSHHSGLQWNPCPRYCDTPLRLPATSPTHWRSGRGPLTTSGLPGNGKILFDKQLSH